VTVFLAEDFRKLMTTLEDVQDTVKLELTPEQVEALQTLLGTEVDKQGPDTPLSAILDQLNSDLNPWQSTDEPQPSPGADWQSTDEPQPHPDSEY